MLVAKLKNDRYKKAWSIRRKKYLKNICNDFYCIYFIVPMFTVTGYFVVTVSHGLPVLYSKVHEGDEEL